MRTFAITYPQLMNQAIEHRLDAESLAMLKRSFDFALPLVDGMYRAQGVPFIDHFVRTASIVLADGQPVHVVSAAMLHGVLFLHSFAGSRRRRPRQADRAMLRRELGEDVATLIAHYSSLRWFSAEAVLDHASKLRDYPLQTRHVLVMRLANEMEDHLDRAMLYSSVERSEGGTVPYLPQCAQLADTLGLLELAMDIRELLAVHDASSVPAALARAEPRGYQLRRQHWRSNVLERAWYRAEAWLRR